MNTQDLKALIRNVPNFPKPGIVYRDITTLLQSPQGFEAVIHTFVERYQQKNIQIDAVAGIESRGFIYASVCAYALHLPLILIRKKGKLPALTLSHDYELEYGENTLEMHTDALSKGAGILLMDDLLATGGTALAACKLIEKAQGHVVEIATMIELKFLRGRERLAPIPVFSQIVYEEE